MNAAGGRNTPARPTDRSSLADDRVSTRALEGTEHKDTRKTDRPGSSSSTAAPYQYFACVSYPGLS